MNRLSLSWRTHVFFSVPDLGFDDNLVSRKAAFDRVGWFMIGGKKVDSLRSYMIRMQTGREENATMEPDETTKDLSKRDLITTTATAEGGTDSTGPGTKRTREENLSTSWDLVADVVVISAGAAGLPAAIKAVDGGASVIVVETNYDIGGHAIISGGNTPLGGGTSAQRKH
ncbi:MAG TPA: FAD-binding protein, partial [Candidatus Acidoferrum sp.]|nr:FAD-binding protein [Candidatus Acidoferrum sp.]